MEIKLFTYHKNIFSKPVGDLFFEAHKSMNGYIYIQGIYSSHPGGNNVYSFANMQLLKQELSAKGFAYLKPKSGTYTCKTWKNMGKKLEEVLTK